MDLDVQNILFDEDQEKIWVVDTEDSYEGNFVFDLAWLSSRLYLSANPMESFSNYNQIFINFIKDIDKSEPNKSIMLYFSLLGAQLTFGLMNPGMINNYSNEKNFRQQLRSILKVLEKELF